MAEYNFWADLLSTVRSTSDWIKALLILVPPSFVLGLVLAVKRRRHGRGKLKLD